MKGIPSLVLMRDVDDGRDEAPHPPLGVELRVVGTLHELRPLTGDGDFDVELDPLTAQDEVHMPLDGDIDLLAQHVAEVLAHELPWGAGQTARRRGG